MAAIISPLPLSLSLLLSLALAPSLFLSLFIISRAKPTSSPTPIIKHQALLWPSRTHSTTMFTRTEDPGPELSSARATSSFTIPCSYAPLPAGDEHRGHLPTCTAPASPRRHRALFFALRTVALAFACVFLVAIVLSLTSTGPDGSGPHVPQPQPQPAEGTAPAQSRGPSQGVSEKSSGVRLGDGGAGSRSRFPWTKTMLLWQRTAFHFQPEKNWMNDPDGPLYYRGWYHLFYQYNPDSAVWGNITWGHAISRDLVHWLYLPIALFPDRWYDANGVWTGSATLLPDGRLVMLYTGSTNASVQVQNLAFPEDPSDPLLLRWTKYDAGNPVLVPPPGIATLDFRDPTTAWYVADDGAWRVAIGSKDAHKTGLTLVYATKDFYKYELLDGVLHAVPGTGMWECVDFYPVATEGKKGLDTSDSGPGMKHVLKASLDDDKHDYYAIGTYDPATNTWTPDDPEADVGIGLRQDYGKFYASKTFYDQERQRRVLWGWIGEEDSELTDLKKGWASLMAIPRTVLLDHKTGSNLVQWPVQEVERLRKGSKEFAGVKVSAGFAVPLDVGASTQLDIEAEFEVDKETLDGAAEADVGYNCSTSAGAAGRGALGPFGLLVLADENLSEQTAVYFYIAKKADGGLRTFICQDELRSSKANDLVKMVYGSTVPVLDGEKLSLRILVDHSIVETFGQGGRACITSRVYPTEAIDGGARVFLFNNATSGHVTATSVKVWQMSSAYIRPYAPADAI